MIANNAVNPRLGFPLLLWCSIMLYMHPVHTPQKAAAGAAARDVAAAAAAAYAVAAVGGVRERPTSFCLSWR